MKHFAGWQAVLLSFFSPELYRDVVQNWRGVAFLYLFALMAVIMALQAVRLQYQTNRFVEQYATQSIRQFPKVKIESGELSIDKPSPQYVKDSSGKPIIVFDISDLKDIKNPETGKPLLRDVDSPAPSVDYAGPLIIAGKKDIVFWDGKKAKVSALAGMDKIEVDQSTINAIVDLLRKWLGVIVFSLAVPFLFCLHVVQVLLYGLIGKLFAAAKKLDLSYPALVRLSVIAVTPSIVIDTVLHLVDQSASIFGFWPMIAFALALIYLFVGVNANSGSSEAEIKSS